jgi:hypothetical protein
MFIYKLCINLSGPVNRTRESDLKKRMPKKGYKFVIKLLIEYFVVEKLLRLRYG